MVNFTFREWVDSQPYSITPLAKADFVRRHQMADSLPSGKSANQDKISIPSPQPDYLYEDFINDAQQDKSFPNISSLEELLSYVSYTVSNHAEMAWKKYERDLSQGDFIKKTKTFVMKKFKRQMQDAKNQKIPVFLCVKNDNQLIFFCPYCLKEHRHGAEGGRLKQYKLTLRSAHCFDDTPLKKTGYYIYYK